MALGVAMVKDAAQGVGDLSVLVTTDTDLTPAVTAAEVAPIGRSTLRVRQVASHPGYTFRRM